MKHATMTAVEYAVKLRGTAAKMEAGTSSHTLLTLCQSTSQHIPKQRNIRTNISLIHSAPSLFYDRSLAAYKASSPHWAI
jgi:hypothetical protein